MESHIFRYLYGVTATTCVAVALIILIVDLYTPLGITVEALYVIPLILSLLADNRGLTFILAIFCTGLVTVGFAFSPSMWVSGWVVVSNRVIVIFLIWISAILGVEMTKAKRQIRELSRMLTICAWTKQIKVDDRWIPIEEYLRKHLHLKLSHGISREAAAQIFRDNPIDIE